MTIHLRQTTGVVLDTACYLSDQDLFMGFYGLCIIKAHTAVYYPFKFSHHVPQCIHIGCPRWLRLRSAQVSAYHGLNLSTLADISSMIANAEFLAIVLVL